MKSDQPAAKSAPAVTAPRARAWRAAVSRESRKKGQACRAPGNDTRAKICAPSLGRNRRRFEEIPHAGYGRATPRAARARRPRPRGPPTRTKKRQPACRTWPLPPRRVAAAGVPPLGESIYAGHGPRPGGRARASVASNARPRALGGKRPTEAPRVSPASPLPPAPVRARPCSDANRHAVDRTEPVAVQRAEDGGADAQVSAPCARRKQAHASKQATARLDTPPRVGVCACAPGGA